MKKKIALMTWHHANNYGTAFQAYALSKLIEETGCLVDLIEYRRIGKAPLDRLNLYAFLYKTLIAVRNRIQRKIPSHYTFSEETFENFYSINFTYTHKCQFNQDFRALNAIYDGFVCGSDQIWGPEWFDARFFLDFVDDPRKIIAYAPSIGVSQITNTKVAKEMGLLMGRYPCLSVREETGCRIATELTGRKDVVNVLDPVLTLPNHEWDLIKEPVQDLPQKFMLIFFLKNNERNIRTALEAAVEMEYSPIVLHCTQSEDTQYANTEELTPGQLLTCVQNADYICTDSFHITVLSIIFSKNFKVFNKDLRSSRYSKNNRISDLLKRLEICNAEYDLNSSFKEVIDYQIVNLRLAKLRKESFNFLKTAIDSLPLKSSEVKREMYCEKKALEEDGCRGEYIKDFLRYGNCLKGLSRKIFLIMADFPFSLEKKCYRCKYYKAYLKIPDNRKPMFWEELQKAYGSKRSIFYIFLKYYFVYFVLSKVFYRK